MYTRRGSTDRLMTDSVRQTGDKDSGTTFPQARMEDHSGVLRKDSAGQYLTDSEVETTKGQRYINNPVTRGK